ncbi:MAG: hypothetical protein ACYC8T_02845, partial [Myxococcaceae bacterium]
MSGRLLLRSAVVLLALALAGCLQPVAPRNCLEAGTCECMERADCPGGEDCIDGRCGWLPDSGDPNGLFGMPCTVSGECDSGLCLPPGPGNGNVCTEPCAAGVACPREWQCKGFDGGAPRVCVPPIDTLCQPCAKDSNCNATGDGCLGLDAGRVCGRDCTQDPCPPGYACAAFGATFKQCLPAGGTCECTAVSVGLTRSCAVSADAGRCFGHHTCEGTGAWSACDAPVPSREVCNGVDDDCDGLLDTDDPGIDRSSLPSSPPYPTCRKGDAGSCVGTWSCHAGADGGVGWDCSATDPRPEECNNLDDDCNGRVDEPFLSAGRYLTEHHCGNCGYDCDTAVAGLAQGGADGGVMPGAVACELRGNTPTCVPKACAPGFYLYPAAAPVMCMKSVTSACRPCTADPDCQVASDRCVTVGNDPGTFCAQGCDVSAPYPGCTGLVGVQGCCPGGFLCGSVAGAKRCVPVGNSCTCNPQRAGATRSCFVTSSTQTCVGLETCDGGAWSTCSTQATTTELCDYQDNDCDGRADEPYISTRDSGTYDTDTHCGNCETNCLAMWSPTIQHAIGGCVVRPAPLGCQIVACTAESMPGGGLCQLDSDCAAGRTCHPLYQQCVRACGTSNDCAGNPCVSGYCTFGCTSDAQCASAAGSGSTCQAGVCKVRYQFVNADKEPTNGCECPAPAGVVDVPDVYAVYPDAGWPYVDRDCDLVDGVAAKSLFVWSGSPGNSGTRQSPYRTLSAAIAAYNPSLHTAVLVAAGSYLETVVLKNGAKVFGGYSPDFSRRDPVAFPTLVEGPQ